MNRFFFLIILLNMFLSCGNSSNSAVLEFPGNEPRSSNSVLTREQQLMSDKLDALFTNMNTRGLFNGSVLVAKAGKIIYRKSIGLLDKASRSLLTDSSMFQLASVSKVFTATAVLMLHERGALDINKPLAEYFTDFPYPNITIKQLLNHRSGLQNYIYVLNREISQPDYRMTNEEMYRCFINKNCRLCLKPNSRFNYCNTNYALLALLVERISGKDFGAFMNDELFQPLGMKHTRTIRDLDLSHPNVTRPYDNRWRPVEFDASDYVLGDKSLYSTPYDLYLFSEALYGNKIISAETQALAYTAFSKEKKQSNYGLGWRMHNFNNPEKKEVFHNGWWHGYRSSFHRRLKDTLTVVVLSNQLNSSAYQTYRIYDIIDRTTGSAPAEDDEQ
jgi:CubicO group peptidase (beta-lactamase class C family)